MAAANRVFSLSDTFLASRQMSARPGDTWFVPARLWPTEKANSTPHGRGWIAHVQSVQRIAARGDAVTFLCEGETDAVYSIQNSEQLAEFVRACVLLTISTASGHRAGPYDKGMAVLPLTQTLTLTLTLTLVLSLTPTLP